MDSPRQKSGDQPAHESLVGGRWAGVREAGCGNDIVRHAHDSRILSVVWILLPPRPEATSSFGYWSGSSRLGLSLRPWSPEEARHRYAFGAVDLKMVGTTSCN